MPGYFALILHAHLPFVRHPEHERFLEESWFFEAVTECYLPLIELLEAWERDRLQVRITLTLSPTLCTMLLDPLLCARYEQRLDALIELADREVMRTRWEPALHRLAAFYQNRFRRLRQLWIESERNLVAAFRRLQTQHRVELIPCAATHAVLPLLADHPPSLRGQVLTARDHYRGCFGTDPVGFWLPECAYEAAIEPALSQANLRWFVLDTHGLLNGTPPPRYGVFAPVYTPGGLAAFAREPEAARQVWSRQGGYPGDPHYRDFYRDAGYDLEFEYVRPYLPMPDQRGFTGLKYHRITGPSGATELYDRDAALRVARTQARHFLEARRGQLGRLSGLMETPPILVAPYDAELFGHWWYEGLDFLDAFVREALQSPNALAFVTPSDYLRRHQTHELAQPAASSWGEGGHLAVWLNEKNEWIRRHLAVAQQRMAEVADRWPPAHGLELRALQQAARELMLAQASDWPFILHTGTSPGYARRRLREHLLRFSSLYRQLTSQAVDEPWLSQIESLDNLFPGVNHTHWAPPS
jgi:1,4-alpha-glucan branching enzyme